MNDPFADDGWDELTKELGVEKASPVPVEDDAPPEPMDDDSAAAAGDEFDAGLEPDGEAPDGAEAPGDEQPGTGKKRRRRRRRRKKGPGEAENGDEATPTAETESAPAAEPESSFEDEYETGPGSETDELTPVPVGAEEDTAGEALRDLIANWNVPSWDSIITGLHRPERHER